MRRGRFITICLAALLAMALLPGLASATPASVVDNTFAGGDPGANTDPSGGVLTLNPTVEVDQIGGFGAGPALPTGWTSTPWDTGGDATVTGGVLDVDGTLVAAPGTFDAGESLEFTATFGDQPFRHVGFGANFNDPPWAMFSTGGGALATGLYARTNIAGTQVNESIAGFDPTVPHDYEIQWTATAVFFFVDGTLVSTQAVTLPDAEHVLASDFNVGGGALTVNNLSLVSYPASGTFTSRVLDAGTKITSWGALTGAGDLTGVTFETRSGNTPVPDASWSGFQALGANGAIQSPVGRYIQYRATLTGDTSSTPFLTSVTIGFDNDTTAPTTTIAGVTVVLNSATVSFSSPDADVARFECSIDGGAYVACASPKAYTGLAVGNHSVSVRAVDKVGNTGAPATRAFTITKPPLPPVETTRAQSSSRRLARSVRRAAAGSRSTSAARGRSSAARSPFGSSAATRSSRARRR